jgi:hypothetical protein
MNMTVPVRTFSQATRPGADLEVSPGPDGTLQLVVPIGFTAAELTEAVAGMEPGKAAEVQYTRFFRGWDDLMQVINALWLGGQDAFGPACKDDLEPNREGARVQSAADGVGDEQDDGTEEEAADPVRGDEE